MPVTTSPIREIQIVAVGDQRDTANRGGWPVQERAEQRIKAAFISRGCTVTRAHDFDPNRGHGFINSQEMGNRVFRSVDPDKPL